ncbi:MAG: NAD-dependent epimerase/dehydratase family protein [Candidatus Aegiribacteria sp.]|nr:NAD-dependent epimerase/dehydratase family protein [Candidatus Aegiribacteria sp.]MBD3295402.1 NAD-dependent epimerase/dehydratase family protein [Candidatus Fermentibacteria bacterium]
MDGKVLITGGAGFIGSHLVDALLARGAEVRVLDCLDPQVHGSRKTAPDYLNAKAEFVMGDVRDHQTVGEALEGCDYIVHFAAAVGVGQSMYRMEHYTSVNSLGASVVLEEVAGRKDSIRKMLVASSMSIYGEGMYRCSECGDKAPGLRSAEQLAQHRWEVLCPSCGKPAAPIPVPESKPLYPASIYAINKRSHEEMFLVAGRAYDIPAVAMRFFNVYGSRQALSNPYTGVGAIFASRLLNGNPPVIFEDGGQSRDFIHVKDVARACAVALEDPAADFMTFNVGTGKATSILEIARLMALHLGRSTDDFVVRNQYRAGDIRHCCADISLIKSVLGFHPDIDFEDGVKDLCQWVSSCTASDRVDSATRELEEHGLTT